MSPTKFFTIVIVALAGFCSSAEAQMVPITINFEGIGVVGGLLDADQTPVVTPAAPGNAFITTVAGDDAAGNPIVAPGLMITTVGASDDPQAVINGVLNNGIGINSDVNFFDPPAANEEAAEVEASFGESLTFTFNQDVTITDVEFFGIDNSADSTESVSFAGQTLLGPSLGTSDVFTFAPGLFIPANNPIVFAEITGDGVALENFTILATIPEPGSLTMLGFGSVLMMIRRRRS